MPHKAASPSRRLARTLRAAPRYLYARSGLAAALHRPRVFLGLYAVMRDEAAGLREWVEAHLREGVERVFLIDHGSRDAWRETIADHLASGVVAARSAPPGIDVDEVRIRWAGPALAACRWLLIADLDEFAYARGPESLAEVLRRAPPDVAQIKIPWLLFGTNGNARQPASVVEACRRREAFEAPPVHPWHSKAIVRSARVAALRIHAHAVAGRTALPLPDWPTDGEGPFVPARFAAREPDLLIAQNHYAWQSAERVAEKARRPTSNPLERAKRAPEELAYQETLNNAVPDDRLYRKHADLFDAIASGLNPRSSNSGSRPG